MTVAHPIGVNRGIDWDAQPLGQMSDVAIARRIGCAHETVRRARVHRGIAPHAAAWRGIYRRKHSPTVLAAMRHDCDGMTARQIAATIGLSEDTVCTALKALRTMGLVRRAKSAMAYDGPWPDIDEPHAARVLRQIRRQPRTVTELADDMAPLDPDRDNLPIVSHRVRKLRKYGHVAPPGAWLMSTTRATKRTS